MANYGPQCWNYRCVLKPCDGKFHTDAHLHAWTQEKDWVFNPGTRNYEPPQQKTDVDPQTTSPRP